MGEFPRKWTYRGNAGIIRLHIANVVGQDQASARREGRSRSKTESNAATDRPASQVHGVTAAIEELNPGFWGILGPLRRAILPQEANLHAEGHIGCNRIGGKLMHLYREEIGARHEVGDRDGKRPAVGRRGDADTRQVGVMDGATRHVLPIDFKAVQVINRPIVHDGMQGQLAAVGLSVEHERSPKVIGDDRHSVSRVEGQLRVLRRRQDRRRVIEERRGSRPGAVVIAGSAPSGSQINTQRTVLPEVRDADKRIASV